jgi:hypothetical protein
LNTASEVLWLASFAKSIAKSGDSPRTAPQSIDSRPECRALLMRETIAWLDRCPYSRPHGSTEGIGQQIDDEIVQTMLPSAMVPTPNHSL